MIFLTVGNWPAGFDRLVQAIDELKGRAVITEDIVAQVAFGRYQPAHLKTMAFCSPTEFIQNVEAARLVVTHAGIGSVGQAAMMNKPVIVVPRKADLGEAGDNHQWTTAKQLEQEGKVLVAYETTALPEKLKQAETFVPVREEGGRHIVSLVESFVADIAKKKSYE